MKAKRRQELRTNELAQMLLDLRAFYQKYANYIWGGALAVVVVLAAGTFWHRSTQGRVDQAWSQFYTVSLSLQQPDRKDEGFSSAINQLKDLADDAPDQRLRAQARLRLGQVFWAKAMDSAADTAQTTGFLAEARKAYEEVLRGESADPLQGALARLSLAAIAENERQFEQARDLYRQVAESPAVKLTGVDVLASEALERLAEVPEAVTFPPKPASTQPSAGEGAASSPATRTADVADPSQLPSVRPTTQPAPEPGR